MKRYETYKPTGIDWIGEIPKHWEVKRMRFVCSYEKGKNPSHLSFEQEEGMVPYLSMEYLRGNNIETQYTFLDDNLVKSSQNDLLLLWDGANAGEFIDSKDGVLCSTCAKLSPKGFNKSFFKYFCMTSQRYLQDMTNGMGVPHVDSNVLKNMTVAIPTSSEQEEIAKYLDEKCSSVDKVIATQEKRVALLNELKQSVISEAVTRGINPNASLKESGIEWIGKIPEHWEVRKNSHIYNLIGSGSTPNTANKDYYCDSDGIHWLQTGDLNDGYITNTAKQVTHEAVYTLNLKIYSSHSIVIAMYGATIGKVGILDINTAVNQACCVLSESKLLNKKYSFYSFISAKKTLIALSAGGGQPNISQDIIRRLKMPVPPIEEQCEIVRFLDEKCRRFDTLISKANKEIELLEEYKQTIISEAVTGKIKVY